MKIPFFFPPPPPTSDLNFLCCLERSCNSLSSLLLFVSYFTPGRLPLSSWCVAPFKVIFFLSPLKTEARCFFTVVFSFVRVFLFPVSRRRFHSFFSSNGGALFLSTILPIHLSNIEIVGDFPVPSFYIVGPPLGPSVLLSLVVLHLPFFFFRMGVLVRVMRDCLFL